MPETPLLHPPSAPPDGVAAQPPERQLTGTIHEINLLVARLFNRRMKAHGLTRPQWQVLFWLNRQDGLTQTELADLLVIARPPLGKIIDRLEHEGLVERRADEHDRRINRVFKTARVEPLLAPSQAVVLDLGETAMRGMSVDERNELIRLLALARHNLGEVALHNPDATGSY